MVELPLVITQYLDTLTDAEMDRVMSSKMGAAPNYVRDDGCRCLVGTVRDYQTRSEAAADYSRLYMSKEFRPGAHFDHLCQMHGEAEVGAAIRDYICELRTTRELAPEIRTICEYRMLRELVG